MRTGQDSLLTPTTKKTVTYVTVFLVMQRLSRYENLHGKAVPKFECERAEAGALSIGSDEIAENETRNCR